MRGVAMGTMRAVGRGLAVTLLICLLAGCASQANPRAAAGYPAAEVKCQLGRQSVYMTEAHCMAAGGMVLP